MDVQHLAGAPAALAKRVSKAFSSANVKRLLWAYRTALGAKLGRRIYVGALDCNSNAPLESDIALHTPECNQAKLKGC